MLSVTYKPFMLSVIMLNAVKLSVIMSIVVAPKKASVFLWQVFSGCSYITLGSKTRVFIEKLLKKCFVT
jgi:hypothetical protein